MLHKKTLKGFSMGLFVGVSLVVAGSAFASPIQKQLNVVYNDIKLVVNGSTAVPKDSEGKVVSPFISDGTTYLPVRAVSELLGQPVDWDGQTSTIYIGKKPDTLGTGLTTLNYARLNGGVVFDHLVSVAGTHYDKGIMLNEENTPATYGGEVVYNVNTLYKKFEAVFGNEDSWKNYDGKVRLLVMADGKQIYDTGDVLAGDIKKLDLDITGVNQLKFAFTYSSVASPVLANPILK